MNKNKIIEILESGPAKLIDLGIKRAEAKSHKGISAGNCILIPDGARVKVKFLFYSGNSVAYQVDEKTYYLPEMIVDIAKASAEGRVGRLAVSSFLKIYKKKVSSALEEIESEAIEKMKEVSSIELLKKKGENQFLARITYLNGEKKMHQGSFLKKIMPEESLNSVFDFFGEESE